MKKIKLIIVVAAAAFGSCKKSNHDAANSGTSTIPPTPVAIISRQLPLAANPANPYDSIGILHNVFLDTLRKYVLQTKDTSRACKAAYLQQVALYAVITDVMGRQIFKTKGSINYINELLNSSNLSRGMYMLRLSNVDGKTSFREKIIRN